MLIAASGKKYCHLLQFSAHFRSLCSMLNGLRRALPSRAGIVWKRLICFVVVTQSTRRGNWLMVLSRRSFRLNHDETTNTGDHFEFRPI